MPIHALKKKKQHTCFRQVVTRQLDPEVQPLVDFAESASGDLGTYFGTITV
jgi:hypothetical protein